MNEAIAKRAYDRGYDAGVAERMTPHGWVPNPYKPVKNATRAYSCFELWNMGHEDGFRGRERRKSKSEAERIEQEHVQALEAFRTKVLEAFADERLHCECEGVCHETNCPLGELEVEADMLWRAKEGLA